MSKVRFAVCVSVLRIETEEEGDVDVLVDEEEVWDNESRLFDNVEDAMILAEKTALQLRDGS